MIRSGNPALKADTFNVPSLAGEETMSIQGTVWKTWTLLLLVSGTAYWSWNRPEMVLPYWIPLCLVSFGVGLVTIFKRTWAPLTAPLYALLQGLMLGAISMMFEKRYPGIVMQAVTLTFATLGALLLAYQSRLIKVTENLKLGITAATGAIALTYLIDLGLSFFGRNIPVIHEATTWGIVFSVFVVGIAAFNLVLDFDFIESGANSGAPKYMEWYGAFGLMITLIWLYLELLRLLSKSRSRRSS